MTQFFLEALHGNKTPYPPLWLMRQAGRYLLEYNEVRQQAGSFLDLCYNPVLAAQVTLQPIQRFGFDASIIFSDILVIPHALGLQLKYINGEGPQLQRIFQPSDVDSLKTQGVVERLKPVMEAITLVKAKLPEHTTMIGFAGAPWTVAAYMFEGGGSKDFSSARGFAYRHPETFKRVLDILVDVTSDYLIAQIHAGAQAVQLFDSWAGMVPAEQFDAWVIAPARAIVDRVKQVHPTTPMIGFPKGSGLRYAEFAKKTGMQGVSVDYTVPLDWAAENLAPHVCLQGNMDPALLVEGTPEAIRAGVKRIKDAWKNKPFIFNLGHGILPATSIENVQTLIEAVRGE